MLHAKYRISSRQSSAERSQSRNGQTTQGNVAFPTTQQFLERILQEIVSQFKCQQRQGIHEQQQELFKIMASVVIAWSLDEKQSEKITANQPEWGRSEEDVEAAE